MKGVRIHGLLMVIALLWAFQTWSRDYVSLEDREMALMWDEDTTSVVSVSYRSSARDIDLFRRTDGGAAYLWGVERRRGGDGDAVDTLEYPVGVSGHSIVRDVASLRVLRDLGTLAPERMTELGLDDSQDRLIVEFVNGQREMALGDSVYGGSDRYALELGSGTSFVLPAGITRPFQTGEGALRERWLHHYPDTDVARARLQVAGRERTMVRVPGPAGAPAVWSPPESRGTPDPGFANFMERAGQLAISDYRVTVARDALVSLLRIDYLDEDGDDLGFVELFRDPGAERDAYYLLSERTRVLARAVTSLAERVDQDLADLF